MYYTFHFVFKLRAFDVRPKTKTLSARKIKPHLNLRKYFVKRKIYNN